MAFRRLGGYGQSYVVRRLGGYGQSYGGGYGAEADPLAAAILGALGMGLQTFDMVRGIRQERADRRAEAAREQAEAERRTMLDERDNARYQEQRSDAILAEARADRRDREREKRTTDRENANYLRNRGISVIPNGMGGTTYTKVAQTDDELAAAVADRQTVDRLRQQAKALGIPDAAQMTRGELEILTSAALAQRKSDAEFSDFKRRTNYTASVADARAAKDTGGANGARVAPENKEEMPLRKEFNQEMTRHMQIAPALAKIKESAKLGTGQGDIGIIYGFMRLQDPGSTVREGEYATAQNSAGIPDQVRQLYNKALSGEKLVPEVRDRFVTAANRLGQQEREQARKVIERYAGLATRYGMSADAIVYDPYDAVYGMYQGAGKQGVGPDGRPFGQRRPLSQVVGGVR